jgi:hypothetical protein
MSLLEYQSAMGRLIRSAAAPDALQELSLDDREQSCIHAMTRSAGYHFTLGVQRSWCVRRAQRASLHTLSMLPAELRTHLIDEWIACGGGTSSFEAIEADAMLEFIAGRLPYPSHEWTVCRFEQAALRVHEGTFVFKTPDTSTLDAPGTLIRRGRYAGNVEFYGNPETIMEALSAGKALPAVADEVQAVLMFGPGIDGLYRPGSGSELALWEALTLPRRVGALLGEGHEPASIAKAMMAGLVEVADSHHD